MGSSHEAMRELHKAGRSARCWLISTCTLFSTCGSRSGSSRWCQGEAYLVRFADDFVVSFQYKRDAERFQQAAAVRVLRGSTWTLAEEKTRLMLFGRFAADRRAEYGQKPDTFEFLGFKHVCGKDRSGAIRSDPSSRAVKSCRKFLARTTRLAKAMHALETPRPAASSLDDAERLLSVLRLAPL